MPGRKYTITYPLDDNQWNKRRVIKKCCPSQYKYCDAMPTEVAFKLSDSTESKHLVIPADQAVHQPDKQTVSQLLSQFAILL